MATMGVETSVLPFSCSIRLPLLLAYLLTTIAADPHGTFGHFSFINYHCTLRDGTHGAISSK
jgi:hypothetical protein